MRSDHTCSGPTCTSSFASEAADAFTLWLVGLAVADLRRVAARLLDMDLHQGQVMQQPP